MTEPRRYMRMQEKLVLRIVAKRLVPFVLLFALYVQFHGDFGPGGGFQAGVIFTAGLILYAMIFGLDALQRAAPPRVVEIAAAAGVLLFAGVGISTMLLGSPYLDYDALAPDAPLQGQHLGILLVEFGVLLTVAAVMLTVYYAFAGQRRP